MKADASKLQRWIEDELARLPEHALHLLKKFLKVHRLSENTKKTYLQAVLSYVRVTSTPLEEACNQILTKWYNCLNREGYEPGTIFLFGTRLRRLYAFTLTETGVPKDEARVKARGLFEAIPLHQLMKEAERRNELRDKLISSEAFGLMLRATDHPRLKALLVMLYESGARAGELLSLRIRDVEFHDKYVQIRVSGKTGERTIPLVRSIPYLRVWMQVHPDRTNPEAPLFIVSRGGKLRPMKYNSVSTMFSRLRRRAGISRRIYPHMFRHTRLTELAKRGLGEYQLKSFAGWAPSSKMAARYIHLSGRTCLAPVLELEGITIQRHRVEAESPIRIRTCPRCGAENEVDALYCNRCSFVLNERVLHAKRKMEAELGEVMGMLMEHPMVREAVKKALKEFLDKGEVLVKHGAVEVKPA